MDTKILELKKQLSETSMEIEREINNGKCAPEIQSMVFSAIKPYQHMIFLILDYLDEIQSNS